MMCDVIVRAMCCYCSCRVSLVHVLNVVLARGVFVLVVVCSCFVLWFVTLRGVCCACPWCMLSACGLWCGMISAVVLVFVLCLLLPEWRAVTYRNVFRSCS